MLFRSSIALYKFEITNTGNVALTGVALEDSPNIASFYDSSSLTGTACSIPNPLTANGSFTCYGGVDWASGIQKDTATATGAFQGANYSDTDEAYYSGVGPGILLKKYIYDGSAWQNADSMPGPEIPDGTDPLFKFEVTNTGDVTLMDLALEDDPTVNSFYSSTDLASPCSIPATLASSGSFTCYASLPWATGQQTDTGTARGFYTPITTPIQYSYSNSANYFGVKPGIQVLKYVSSDGSTWDDANTGPGPEVPGGTRPYYKFVITNSGDVTLTDITLNDVPAVSFYETLPSTVGACSFPAASLAAGESLTCYARSFWTSGQHMDTVTASGVYSGANYSDTDNAYYTGVIPGLYVLKSVSADGGTTWNDANLAPGLAIQSGINPLFKFVVTNSSDALLTNLSLEDSPAIANFYAEPGLINPCLIPDNLAPSKFFTCYGSQVWQAGLQTDTATAKTSFQGNQYADTDTANYTGTMPGIGIAKELVGDPLKVAPGIFEITYRLLVRNYGSAALTDVQVSENLEAMFQGHASFKVKSLASDYFKINPQFTGEAAHSNLLLGSDALPVPNSDSYKTITLVVDVTPSASGPFNNTAVASAKDSLGGPVTDESQNGANPDCSLNCTPGGVNLVGDPTNNNEPTPVTFGAGLFDPPFGIKTFDDNGLPVLRWSMVWINETRIPALKAYVSDPISEGTTYAGNLVCEPASSLTTTTICAYEPASTKYPRGRVVWLGTLGPDQGALDAASAKNEIVISFDVNVPVETSKVKNVASVDADLNGNGSFDEEETFLALSSINWQRSAVKKLPSTGFAPDVQSVLPIQSAVKSYAASDLVLEIPDLGVRTDILGVPFVNGGWDTTWLGQNAGYLQGTAFPSWKGNSVITAHLYGYNGLPGPFVDLGTLKWGSQVIVHAYGYRYIYSVRTVMTIQPEDVSVLGHMDDAWLTLLTCKGYNAAENTYRSRTAVRAVLLQVIKE